MTTATLIEQYLAGPALLRAAVAGLSRDQLVARPIAGKWSTLEVVCHLADFEIVYADRIKRIVVEDKPTMFGGDPDAFAAGLAYQSRDIDDELALIEAVRRQVGRVLETLPPAAFQRVGMHSEAGPLTLETIVQRITGHIPHHIKFIEAKKAKLLG